MSKILSTSYLGKDHDVSMQGEVRANFVMLSWFRLLYVTSFLL
jgi:hypothetical protein